MPRRTGAPRAERITAASAEPLSFAAGEASKTFTVSVSDDSQIDGNKIFKVTLSSPTGAALGQATSML